MTPGCDASLGERAGLASLWAGAGQFGISCSSLFRLENPRFRGLDFLGFPWILSSETRLINGLHGINRENFFVALFPRRWMHNRVSQVEAMRRRQVLHGGYPTSHSGFPQAIAIPIALPVSGSSGHARRRAPGPRGLSAKSARIERIGASGRAARIEASPRHEQHWIYHFWTSFPSSPLTK